MRTLIARLRTARRPQQQYACISECTCRRCGHIKPILLFRVQRVMANSRARTQTLPSTRKTRRGQAEADSKAEPDQAAAAAAAAVAAQEAAAQNGGAKGAHENGACDSNGAARSESGDPSSAASQDATVSEQVRIISVMMLQLIQLHALSA